MKKKKDAILQFLLLLENDCHVLTDLRNENTLVGHV